MSGPGVVLLVILVAALVALACLWWCRRDDPDFQEAPARADDNDPYNSGRLAALVGFEFWENPHASPPSDRTAYSRWLAGWCYGRQQMEE